MPEENIRPPYVTFETRAVEDRSASQEKGHFVAVDVDFALITPLGSKDRVEKDVNSWFASLDEMATQERIPSEWPQLFRTKYKLWKESKEDPVDGTALNLWPAITPAVLRNLNDLGLRSVEDLAAANEETINRIGMGGRGLKQKAQAYLDAAGGQGKLASEIESLRQKNEELQIRDTEREKVLADLQAQVKNLTSLVEKKESKTS